MNAPSEGDPCSVRATFNDVLTVASAPPFNVLGKESADANQEQGMAGQDVHCTARHSTLPVAGKT